MILTLDLINFCIKQLVLYCLRNNHEGSKVDMRRLFFKKIIKTKNHIYANKQRGFGNKVVTLVDCLLPLGRGFDSQLGQCEMNAFFCVKRVISQSSAENGNFEIDNK